MLRPSRRLRIVVMLCLTAVILQPLTALGGHQFFRNQGVGGISISPAGVVKTFDPAARKLLLGELRKTVKTPGTDLLRPTKLRMVSLKGLNAAIEHALANNLGALPNEVKYLAGLQRIQYVFVYPEANDIVLAGPGEGWKVAENASVVGVTTGQPVLQLEHLITALRYVRQAKAPISVSIDPTEEGYQRLNELLARARRSRRGANPKALEPAMKEALGPQTVTLQGVPANSHFARVLVAADYKMKRLAMNLDKSPVADMPSFVHMISGRKVSSQVNPRWWLACNYEPLARGEDGLAWEIRGKGVKAMTENDLVNEAGQAKATGRKDPVAQKWADTMTAKYAELAAKEPVFGELRNIMDMCIVAALLDQHRLLEKADCKIPLLTETKSKLHLAVWNTPKTVAPECSFLRTSKGWIATASGGVEVNPWETTNKSASVDKAVSEVRSKAGGSRTANQWWWN